MVNYGLWIMNTERRQGRLRRENGTPTARRPYLGEDGGHRRATTSPARQRERGEHGRLDRERHWRRNLIDAASHLAPSSCSDV